LAEFEKTHYSLEDTVYGIVTFKKVGVRLENMELQVIKKESVFGNTAYNETEIITNFVIMDGNTIKSILTPLN
jgi:hypothetical protein